MATMKDTAAARNAKDSFIQMCLGLGFGLPALHKYIAVPEDASRILKH